MPGRRSSAGPDRAAAWRRALAYGALLALGTVALQGLDYLRLVRTHSSDVYVALVALGFLGLGIYLGSRVLVAPRPAPFDGNPQAVAALGISPRELDVLEQIMAGRSNQEIADRLGVSLNTVKTHVARLLEKLGAKRRTDAIAKARLLGILR